MSRSVRLTRLGRLEREIDRVPIGSDEWNVLYRIVLQERVEQDARPRRRVSATTCEETRSRGPLGLPDIALTCAQSGTSICEFAHIKE